MVIIILWQNSLNGPRSEEAGIIGGTAHLMETFFYQWHLFLAGGWPLMAYAWSVTNEKEIEYDLNKTKIMEKSEVYR